MNGMCKLRLKTLTKKNFLYVLGKCESCCQLLRRIISIIKLRLVLPGKSFSASYVNSFCYISCFVLLLQTTYLTCKVLYKNMSAMVALETVKLKRDILPNNSNLAHLARIHNEVAFTVVKKNFVLYIERHVFNSIVSVPVCLCPYVYGHEFVLLLYVIMTPKNSTDILLDSSVRKYGIYSCHLNKDQYLHKPTGVKSHHLFTIYKKVSICYPKII